jgi:peptidoglycan/xylan/chitin deacetylase (PgdA/CDA1 family)
MLPILCYHKVGPVWEEGRRLNIEPNQLAKHVQYFYRRGVQFVQARDLAGVLPAKSVCLTFDDAYLSALFDGVRVLRAYKATATFFAVPSLVGASSVWDKELARPLASWDVLVDAQKAGFEIGNHTNTHADLSKLDLPSQIAEIEAADDALIAHGISPGSFCYPYGRLNAESVRACQEAQYPVGLALGKRLAQETDDRHALPRIVLAYSDSVAKLIYKMHVRPKLRLKASK